MATYTEVFDLKSDSIIRNKITVAVVKKAQSLIDLATPSANQISWADLAIRNPVPMAEKIMNYVLAANSGLSVSQITGASDSVIQTHVDAAVDKLIAGGIVS